MLEGAEEGRGSSACGGTLEIFINTWQESRCQTLQTQAEMPKGLHILLPGCRNSFLSPLELRFTHILFESKTSKAWFPTDLFSTVYSLMLIKA